MSTFRVLQFNMQYGQVWDHHDPDHAPIDLDLTISEIRAQDADIVFLQEVEQARPDGEQLNPPPNYTRLKEALTGYQSYFSYPKVDPHELPFGIGLAILAKTPLRDTVRVDLPSPAIEFEFHGQRKTPTDRLLIGATTTVNGREMRIYNAHLLAFFMLNASSDQHVGQRRLVLGELAGAETPALLGGDFNVSRHESLLRQFADAGYRTVQSKEVTWRRRPYVLDHVFYSGHLRPVRYSVRPTPASDHYMVLADFEFTDGPITRAGRGRPTRG
jgi:endonuclease/exonuclease/phosphatase family metal-dependent hydrolase